MKKTKIVTIVLAIILVSLVAFAGVYIQKQNRMENKVKGYQLSKELEGGRVIEIKAVEDTQSEKLTVENYETIKDTVEKRLKLLGATDYTISLNKENGMIRVELPENDNTDLYAYYITAKGQVQIKEKDTENELISDSMVKSAKYNYIQNTDGTYQTKVEIILTKEGQAKIEEISNSYALLSDEIDEIEKSQENTNSTETTEETDNTENTDTATNETENTENIDETIDIENNNETENQETTKKIAQLTIGESNYDITKIEKNKITISIGSATSNSTSVQNNISKAAEISMLISSGKYPIDYEIDNNRYEYSEITTKQIVIFAVIILTIILALLILLSIKYKMQGVLVSISYIGFIAVFSLLLRYTNVLISIEGIGAIILVLAMNLRLNENILKIRKVNMVNETVTNTYKVVFLRWIPILILSLVFCFAKWSNLSSFGMIMFWGFTLIAIYNVVVTKTLLKLRESK